MILTGSLPDHPVQAPRRAWMRLPSGQRLDLLNPDPLAWEHTDLSTRLSRTYRWGGESCWPLPLSVAQHSLLVLFIRRNRADVPLTPVQELQELLHDAEEAFLGFDCISPIKHVLGEPFAALERTLSDAVCKRYNLPAWNDEDYRLHKQADTIAAACEAVHCVGWSEQEVRSTLGISAPIFDCDPLQTVYGGAHWVPWPAEVAAQRFLDELMRLCTSRKKPGVPNDTLSATF